MDGWIVVFKSLDDLLAEGERVALEEEQRAVQQRLRFSTGRRIVNAAIAELQALAGSDFPSAGFESANSEQFMSMGWARYPGEFDFVSSGFLRPETDETGELVYDARVVSRKRNNRARALAAARVYGPQLREASLARAIFMTGETKAVDVAAARASLSGLTRYGDDWGRNRGWLIYRGVQLAPDQEMILLLVSERALDGSTPSDEANIPQHPAIVTDVGSAGHAP